MDPYLEDPAIWPDVDAGLISEIQARLNQQLRPRYVARVEERVYISDDMDPGRRVIIPDLRVRKSRAAVPAGVKRAAAGDEGDVITQGVEITELIDDEIHERLLHIYDPESREVVTVIEVISPTNKVKGSRGRKSYLQKRARTTASPTHLVEIDLLRRGTPIIPRGVLPAHDYYVHLSRAVGDDRRAWAWPFALSDTLPVIPIPLKSPDPDAVLSLQKVFQTAFDRGAYDLVVDYSKPPRVRLTSKLNDWADQLLRAKGVRGAA
jgi:hypothetical protein